MLRHVFVLAACALLVMPTVTATHTDTVRYQGVVPISSCASGQVMPNVNAGCFAVRDGHATLTLTISDDAFAGSVLGTATFLTKSRQTIASVDFCGSLTHAIPPQADLVKVTVGTSLPTNLVGCDVGHPTQGTITASWT